MAAKQISEQMELFEEGGLKDEGGMIDEVSGNDVPTGSTREEVRDDIPAQLSEGEFVLPADVVRYHGLEKIMALRDEAKQGLQKMEAMGQMGNSEEATLPDDIPFDMDDLDMEDEDEPQKMEMAEGGYVMVAGKPMPVPTVAGKPLNMQVGGFTSPTGTYQVPTNIATQPSYFQQYSQSTAPFQPFVPPAGQQQTQVQQPVGGLPQQQQTYPSFATLMPTVGGKRETIEYRNEAGQKLFIPFINDKPIYPIPEGYTKYVTEEQPIAEDKPVTSTTTQVTGQDGSDVMTGTTQVSTDFAKQTAEKVQENIGKMGVSERGKTVMDALQSSYGSTGLAKTAQQLATAVVPGALASQMIGQKTFDPRTALSAVGQPDMANRDAITNAFGYDPTGYDFDDPMDANLAGIDQQNAINTAIFGGVMTGTEDKTRGGIQGITVADIQREYGIAPSYTSRGAGNVQISRGTNPGQISSTGTYYDVNGVGNDPDKAEYSSITDMLGYLSTASKLGYAGTLGLAKEQAKQGNKKAQAVVKAMQTKAQQKTQDTKDRAAAERGGTGDLGGIGDLGSGYGIGASTGAGSQTMGIESDVAGIGTSTGTSQGTSATGMSTTDGGLGGGGDPTTGQDPSTQGIDGPSGESSSSSSDDAGQGGEDVAKGSLITKRKASGKLKKKYMKRGGLASRK